MATYAFDDHNAPPFQLIEPFCEDVHEFLNEHPKNVVSIHCKAGKGRTGVMITCYLLHSRMFSATADALRYYGEKRTKNAKGVTIPSQQRYCDYYGRKMRESLDYSLTTLFLKNIRIYTVPNMGGGVCCPFFLVKLYHTKIYTSKPVENVKKNQEYIDCTLDKPLPICGDVKVEFFHQKFNKKEKLCHFWFNTYFIQGETFRIVQDETDKANKDKKHKVFKENFAIEVTFSDEKYAGEHEGVREAKSRKTPSMDNLKLEDDAATEDDLSDDDPENDEWAEDH